MSFLTEVREPRNLPRMHMTCEAFGKLIDLTFRNDIVPRTSHKRQLRNGTWIIERVGTRGDDGTFVITAFRACVRVKAGSRPRAA